jgi:hypothetical protein
MKIKLISIGLFALTFIIGIVLVFFQKENSIPRELNLPTVSTITPQTQPKTEKANIISYETAKNFGGAEMLEEDFFENEKKYKYALLQTGKFHGEEVSAKSGENWLGLFKQNDGFYLTSTKINVKRVYDEIVDESENQKTGKMVSVNNKTEPLFLIKNASELKAGKTETLFGIANPNEFDENNPSKEFRIDSPYDFTFNNENYSLKVEKVFNAKTEIVYALILEATGTKQILNVSNEDYLGSLYWVGDLDQDNKLDFFITPYVKENISESSLFLSSEAEENNLVKKIASMVTFGC